MVTSVSLSDSHPAEDATQCCSGDETAGCCSTSVSPLKRDDATTYAAMFKALGDPIRLQMLAIIAKGPEVCVCDITPGFELSSATVSHHLKTLREAGLVTSQRRGTYVYYAIVPGVRERLAVFLAPG